METDKAANKVNAINKEAIVTNTRLFFLSLSLPLSSSPSQSTYGLRRPLASFTFLCFGLVVAILFLPFPLHHLTNVFEVFRHFFYAIVVLNPAYVSSICYCPPGHLQCPRNFQRRCSEKSGKESKKI